MVGLCESQNAHTNVNLQMQFLYMYVFNGSKQLFIKYSEKQHTKTVFIYANFLRLCN